MVVEMSLLQSGIVLLSRKFKDGSVATFHATSNPDILRSKHLTVGKIYNMDTMKEITDDICNDEYSIIMQEDVDNFNKLDIYLNRGVAGECFMS